MNSKLMKIIAVLCLILLTTVVAADPPPQLAPQTSGDNTNELPERTGFIPPKLDFSYLGQYAPGVSFKPLALPSRYDWRENNGVTSVKNQSVCGACYSFASLANIEGRLKADGAGIFDFSENNVKECNFFQTSCGGGNYHQVANFLSKNGTVLESCDPYVASDVSCYSGCNYQKTLLGWEQLSGSTIPNADDLKNFIYLNGPVYATFYAGDAGNPSWQSELNSYDGSYVLYTTANGTPNHAILIVGWDDTISHAGGQGAWIVKNSWGTSWGGTCDYGTEGGYFYIAYGVANMGTWASAISEYEDYQSTDKLYYYDEAGMLTSIGYANTTAWALVKYTPTDNDYLRRVEFWTTDALTDLDIYVYDDFNGTTLSNLITSEENLTEDYSGYSSIPMTAHPQLAAGDPIYIAVHFQDQSYGYPISADDTLTSESNKCWISSNGSSWLETGSLNINGRVGFDLGIRMRTTPSLGAAADDEDPAQPYVYELYQNSPNPFNPETTIRYSLAKKSDVMITIYNVIGQVVRTLVDDNQDAGLHQVEWDGKDSNGKTVVSGIYFYRITANDFIQTRKMIFLK